MTNIELANILEIKPQQIADKKNSTNRVTALMTRYLLSMSPNMVEQFRVDVEKEFGLVEDKLKEKKRLSAERQKKHHESKEK